MSVTARRGRHWRGARHRDHRVRPGINSDSWLLTRRLFAARAARGSNPATPWYSLSESDRPGAAECSDRPAPPARTGSAGESDSDAAAPPPPRRFSLESGCARPGSGLVVAPRPSIRLRLPQRLRRASTESLCLRVSGT